MISSKRQNPCSLSLSLSNPIINKAALYPWFFLYNNETSPTTFTSSPAAMEETAARLLVRPGEPEPTKNGVKKKKAERIECAEAERKWDGQPSSAGAEPPPPLAAGEVALSSVIDEGSPDEVAESLRVELRVNGGDGGGIDLQRLVGALQPLADVVALENVDDPEVEDRVTGSPLRGQQVTEGGAPGYLERLRRHVRAQAGQRPPEFKPEKQRADHSARL